MDFPGALVQQLGVTEAAAKGLAGQVVALVEDAVREKVSYTVASRIRDAVPELHRWQASTPTLPPGALRLDELGQPKLPGIAPEEQELASTLARFRVPFERAAEVRALTLQFLGARLDSKTFSQIIQGLPQLAR